MSTHERATLLLLHILYEACNTYVYSPHNPYKWFKRNPHSLTHSVTQITSPWKQFYFALNKFYINLVTHVQYTDIMENIPHIKVTYNLIFLRSQFKYFKMKLL